MENKEFANLCDKAKGNQEMWNAGYDKALEDVKREMSRMYWSNKRENKQIGEERMKCPKCKKEMIEVEQWENDILICKNIKCLFYGIERFDINKLENSKR